MTVTDPDPLACTIEDVAAIIRARTKDSSGNELGTFTAETRPTDAQCQEAITHQVEVLHTKVGRVGPDCTGVAQMAVAWGAAAEIELSYFPEQARTDRSPYTYLKQQCDDLTEGVVQCVLGNLPDTPDPDDPDDLSGLRYGTLDAISGTVNAYYTGRTWPALPPPPPAVPPEDDELIEP
jgi:hypothetical protein